MCDSHRWTDWPPYLFIPLSYLYHTALGNFPNEMLKAFNAQVAKLATWQFIRQLANLASWNVYSLIISLTQLDRLTGWNQIVDVGKFPAWLHSKNWLYSHFDIFTLISNFILGVASMKRLSEHFWVKEIYFHLRIIQQWTCAIMIIGKLPVSLTRAYLLNCLLSSFDIVPFLNTV